MFVPEVMHQRAWTAPMRSELVFQRHRAAVLWARAGEIHVNHALLLTQVSQCNVIIQAYFHYYNY